MTTRVPYAPPLPPVDPVQGGRPISSQTWMSAAGVSNYLLGRGATVIPATRVSLSSGIAAGATRDLRAYTTLPYACTTLLWTVSLRSLDGSGRPTAVVVTTPTGGTGVTYPVGAVRGQAPIRHVEQRTSKAGTAVELSIRIAPTTYAVDVATVSCVALPRFELVRDTTDYGIDDMSEAPRQPIYAASAGDGYSLGELANRGAIALARARRSGLFQMLLPDNSGDAIQVTAAAPGSALYANGAPCLGRKLYRSSTTATVTCRILACASAGSTYGTAYADTTSGGSGVGTQTLGTVGTPLSVYPTWTWYGPFTFSVDAEDLTEANGCPGGVFDDVTFRASRDGGAGTIYVATVSGYEA